MADPKYLDILKQGVETWNQWRKEHSDIHIYLMDADLRDYDLGKADLSKARLDRCNFGGLHYYGEISGRGILPARLHKANLRQANLESANLSHVSLAGADLTGAFLLGTDLTGAKLDHVDLSYARLGYTVFGDVDLSTVKGLKTVHHEGPSIVGIDTVYLSQGKISEAFLKGAGVPDSFIEYMRSLISSPIDYYSCFISYSSKDEAFAKRLYADLQSNHVRSWFAPEDLKIGDKIRTGIDEAIRIHDKLLLVLSGSSVESTWVEKEVETAFDKEAKMHKLVLFPVRLDDAVMETDQAWAADIRRMRNIGDFTRWKNHDDYEKAFTRLLRDLKAEAQR